jgi:hypothetical protein
MRARRSPLWRGSFALACAVIAAPNALAQLSAANCAPSVRGEYTAL